MDSLNSLILSSLNNQTCPINDVTGELINNGNYKYIMKNRCFRFTSTVYTDPNYNYNFNSLYSSNTLYSLNNIDPYYCTSLKNQFCLSQSDSFKF